MSAIEAKLEAYLSNNLNVLLTGEHGVGKTALVKQAFDAANLNWVYFSAATMDPWVDFIGVPKERLKEVAVQTPEGSVIMVQRPYLDLVRPELFAEDRVEAIFFDELNRAPKKVRNAVMELIQFRSINGNKFNNLRVIWAAINPDDEEETYDVEKLDPAQRDRFEIHITLPNSPSRPYFTKKYGKEQGIAACDWWRNIPVDIRKEVSPRRLDYALKVFNMGGDLKDVLPRKSNVSALLTSLSSGTIETRLLDIYSRQDAKAAKKLMANDNDFALALPYVKGKDNLMAFFLPHVDDERLTSLLMEDGALLRYVTEPTNIVRYASMLKEALSMDGMPQAVSKKITEAMARNSAILDDVGIAMVDYYLSPAAVTGNGIPYDEFMDKVVGYLKMTSYHDPSLNDQIYITFKENLPQSFTKGNDTFLAIACLFRLMDVSSTAVLRSYDLLARILNSCLKEADRWAVNINHPDVLDVFKADGLYKLNKMVHVQGWLDTYSKHLHVKPRLLG